MGLSIFTWISTAVMAMLLVRPFISIFTTDLETYGYAVEYSLICLVASFGLQLEFMLERILKAFRISTLVSFTMMLSGFIGFQLFAKNLIRIFGDSPETLSIGPTALRRLSLCFLMASFAIPIESVF